MLPSSLKYLSVVAIIVQIFCINILPDARAEQHPPTHTTSENSQSASHECPMNKTLMKDLDTMLAQMNITKLTNPNSVRCSAQLEIQFTASFIHRVSVAPPTNPLPFTKNPRDRQRSTVLLI